MSNALSSQFLAQLIPDRSLSKAPAADAFLDDLANNSLRNLLETGMPETRQEEWKYVELDRLYRQSFRPYHEYTFPDPKVLQQARRSFEQNNFIPDRICLINGEIQSDLSTVREKLGIVYQGLRESHGHKSTFFEAHYNRLIGTSAFGLLNTGLCHGGGLVLDIPPHHVSAETLMVHNLSLVDGEKPLLFNPRILIRLGPKARLKIVLLLSGYTQDDPYFNNLVGEIYLGQQAMLDLTVIQKESPTAYYIGQIACTLAEGADLKIHNFNLGGKFSKSSIRVDLKQEQARTELNGLYVLGSESRSHNQLEVNHFAPQTISQQLYKGILNGNARAEFTGTINVSAQAQKTEASQLNRNLLLSDKAHIDTRPQLQISADDVKCSHGASIGQLAPEQIFYFQTRGFSRSEAERILTFGFAEEIIEKVHPPQLREDLDQAFLAKLAG